MSDRAMPDEPPMVSTQADMGRGGGGMPDLVRAQDGHPLVWACDGHPLSVCLRWPPPEMLAP